MAAMSLPIEDYALIGDLHTGAIVGRDGSIDWLCLPHFDSGACFARLLGTDDHGFWKIAPTGPGHGQPTALPGGHPRARDRVRHGRGHDPAHRLHAHPRGPAPPGGPRGRGRAGHGPHPHGAVRPLRLRRVHALGGPQRPAPDGDRRPERRGPVDAGPRPTARACAPCPRSRCARASRSPFILTWYPSHEGPPAPVDPWYAVDCTEIWWQEWSSRLHLRGRPRRRRAALAHHPEGPDLRADRWHRGRRHDLAARGARGEPELGLPVLLAARRHPDPGGADAGRLPHEAMAWRDWLLRATAGDVSKLQIMYGAAGERRLDEWEVDWLPGYEGSAPVRIGNAASGQFQLDVYGEVMSALYTASRIDGVHSRAIWGLQTKLHRVPRGGVEAPRRRHLGGPGPAPALHPLQGHGLGGGRPGGAHHGGLPRPAGPHRQVAGAARRDPRRGVRRRASTPTSRPSPSTTAATGWTPAS